MYIIDNISQNRCPIKKNINRSLYRYQYWFFLVACWIVTGCGGGSSEPSATNDKPEPQWIQGNAIKGVIQQGQVDIYLIESGSFSRILGTTLTDDSGYYNFSVDETINGPIGIEISAIESSTQITRMVCDVYSGCGSIRDSDDIDTNENGLIDFGESFKLSSEFRMRAVLPNLQTDNQLNVTPLTHLATEYAAYFPLGIHPDSIQIANAQVAKIFSLESSIEKINTLDLTNENTAKNVNTDELNYALYNAALLEFFTPEGIGSGLNTLALKFANANGQLKWTSLQKDEPSLESIAEYAANSAGSLKLERAQLNARSLVERAQSETPESFTNIQIQNSVESDGLAAAKKFINELKNWENQLEIGGDTQLAYENWLSVTNTEILPRWKSIQTPLTVASQFGLLAALPDLALQAVCNSFENNAATALCNLMLNSNNFSALCSQGESGIQFFKADFCELLKEIKIVNRDEVSVTYYFFEKRIKVVGDVSGVDMNLDMVAIPLRDNEVGFTIDGNINDGATNFIIRQSEANLSFLEDIQLTKLNLPKSLGLRLNGILETQDLADNIRLDGYLTMDLDLTQLATEVRDELGSLKLQDTLGLLQDRLSTGSHFTAATKFQGQLTYDSGDQLDTSFDLLFGEDTNLFNLNFNSATLTGKRSVEIQGLLKPTQHARADWIVEKINLEELDQKLTLQAESSTKFSLSNPNSISMKFDLSLRDRIGTLYYNEIEYAAVTKEEDWLYINFSDGTESIISL